ncbi:MAG: class GN sortase [Deltaproteobacteria bacterium]|nr:class GN sortase [Deltaproteobacteria bacterium]MBW2393989.1 class GN sortase [Deltaproteobacteria bacterium]
MNRKLGALGLVAVGCVCLAHSAWIPAKARLAQLLLAHAWERTQAEGVDVRPWPWADTHPVAKLSVPRLGIERMVLAGISGRTMAFGPGHYDGSAQPGTADNIVLAGHRDTHFAFLRELAAGDEIHLEASGGTRQLFRVEETQVLHESQASVMEPTGRAELTLITCFPFDAVVPGGPLRFVVRARAEKILISLR